MSLIKWSKPSLEKLKNTDIDPRAIGIKVSQSYEKILNERYVKSLAEIELSIKEKLEKCQKEERELRKLKNIEKYRYKYKSQKKDKEEKFLEYRDGNYRSVLQSSCTPASSSKGQTTNCQSESNSYRSSYSKMEPDLDISTFSKTQTRDPKMEERNKKVATHYQTIISWPSNNRARFLSQNSQAHSKLNYPRSGRRNTCGDAFGHEGQGNNENEDLFESKVELGHGGLYRCK